MAPEQRERVEGRSYTMKLPDDFRRRLQRVARFSREGTMSSYILETVEKRLEEDEQKLAPILEQLDQLDQDQGA